MDATYAVRSRGRQKTRLAGLVGALVLAVCALSALLVGLHGTAVAEVNQTTGFVDAKQGNDGPGCGASTGTLACKTIQYAIEAPSRYDVIKVTEGFYTESVRIGRNLTLQGGWDAGFTVWNPISQGTTIVGESGTGVDAVNVLTSTTVILDGLTVFRGDDGVDLHPGAGGRLINLFVHGNDDEGIESNGAWLIVSNTVVFDTGDNGILVGAGSAEIYGGSVHGTADRGIYLLGSGPDTISGTVVYNTADDGIRIRASRSGSLINNRVYSATRDGLQIDDVTVVLVEGNTMYNIGGDGLKLDGASWARLRDNTVYDVENQGVQIQNGALVKVETNQVYRTGESGILAENAGGDVLIQGNLVYSTTGMTEDGIHVSPGVVATVQDNTVYSVTDDAIDFKGSRGLVEGNRVSFVGDVGVWISGTSSISVAHNRIHDTTDTGIRAENSGTVFIAENAISHTIAVTADGIYVGSSTAATIDYNTVFSVAADGIDFHGATGWIRYNEVHQIGSRGINVEADDATLLGNKVYDTQNEGLRVQSGSSVLIRGNTIHNIQGEQRDGIHIEPNVSGTIAGNAIFGAADDGITFNGAAGAIIGNDVYDNGASGIDVDAGEVTISSNRVFSNGMSGIELEQATIFTISNNLVGENTVAGVLVIGVSTGRLVNNTLVGHPSNPMGTGVCVLSPTVTLTSANNIIVSHTTGISVTSGAWVTTTYDNLWHNNSNLSGIASGTGNLQLNPLLADVNSRDYHLLVESSCRDAGWAEVAPAFDFEGDPRIGGVDIGADEVVWRLYLPLVLR